MIVTSIACSCWINVGSNLPGKNGIELMRNHLWFCWMLNKTFIITNSCPYSIYNNQDFTVKLQSSIQLTSYLVFNTTEGGTYLFLRPIFLLLTVSKENSRHIHGRDFAINSSEAFRQTESKYFFSRIILFFLFLKIFFFLFSN